MADVQRVLAALTSPVRRQILALIWDRELPAGEIAAACDVTAPTVSSHLAVLREAGLVTAERDGQVIRYELDTSVFQDLIQHLVEWTRPTGGAPRAVRKPVRNRVHEA